LVRKIKKLKVVGVSAQAIERLEWRVSDGVGFYVSCKFLFPFFYLGQKVVLFMFMLLFLSINFRFKIRSLFWVMPKNDEIMHCHVG